jgi:hypothetical protein
LRVLRLQHLPEQDRDKFPRIVRYYLIDRAGFKNRIVLLFSRDLGRYRFINARLDPASCGVIFDDQRWNTEEGAAHLSFGEFEIKNFAGGIRIADRRTAIAFVVTLAPHCRLHAHWRAAERALRARARSLRADRHAAKAFTAALQKDGWSWEWTSTPRTVPKTTSQQRRPSKSRAKAVKRGGKLPKKVRQKAVG